MSRRVRLEPGHLRVERSARSAIVVPPKTSPGNAFGKGHGTGIPAGVLAALGGPGSGNGSQGGVSAAYQSAVLADAPLAYWKLDETSGGTAADSSGNNHPGGYNTVTINQAPLITSGRSALFVAASSSRISWDNASSQFLANKPNFTVEAWIKTTQSGASNPMFVCADDSPGGSNRYFQFRLSTGGKVEFITFDNAGSATTKLGAITINDGTRHHIVGTYGADNNIWVYVDGAADGSAVVGAASHSVIINQLRLGDRYTGSEDHFYDGSLDEVAMYSGALSAARVLVHWNLGK